MVNVSNVIAMLLVVDLSTSDEETLDCESWKKKMFENEEDSKKFQCKKYGEPGRSIDCVIIMK